jgi:inosine/xanthosine triphosphate pyrophosphatase family protein
LVNSGGKVHFFTSKVSGKIVKPKGKSKHGFGFDMVFQPRGTRKTLSELKGVMAYEFSPRCDAMRQLKNYLLKHL